MRLFLCPSTSAAFSAYLGVPEIRESGRRLSEVTPDRRHLSDDRRVADSQLAPATDLRATDTAGTQAGTGPLSGVS